jgi:hypothetical protein
MAIVSLAVRRGGALAVALVPGLAFLLTFVWQAGYDTPSGHRFTLADDAMISMTYARTLVETGEWVWFPGAERVQGFTNPLWTLYMALIHLFGLEGSNAALAVSLTGVVLVLGCSVLVAQLLSVTLEGWDRADATARFAAAAVPFLYPLTFWTVRGMEVGLLALIVLGMAAAVARALRAWRDGETGRRALAWVGLLSAAGVATRLDFIVLAAAYSGLLLTWGPSRRLIWAWVAAPTVLAASGILAFQRMYYGDWLANTYYLKMEGVPVADRIVRGIASLGMALPIIILLSWGAVAISRLSRDLPSRRLTTLLASVMVASLAYNVWVGGDAWE